MRASRDLDADPDPLLISLRLTLATLLSGRYHCLSPKHLSARFPTSDTSHFFESMQLTRSYCMAKSFKT